MYQGYADNPVDEAFDLIAEGLPTVAILTLGRAIRDAEAGKSFGDGEVATMRKMARSLNVWAEWTGRGERTPLASEMDEWLEESTFRGDEVGIEAWREMAIRVGARKILAERWPELVRGSVGVAAPEPVGAVG